jgi:ammonium transporter, Amt family
MDKKWLFPLGLVVFISILGLITPSGTNALPGNPADAADVAWMLTASGLVLLMTPGLSFFYGGMVTRKT